MSMYSRPRLVTIVVRWLLGTTLVSWRYMWQITPLHRVERLGEAERDEPPPLPTDLVDEYVQRIEHGVGPLFHRVFSVRITGARSSAEELVDAVASDFKRFVPSEIVDIGRSGDAREALTAGEEFVVVMPGPWDGPVRVMHRDTTSLRLATLQGHLEAGQVRFGARPEGTDLVFTVEAWARPSTRTVQVLYCHLRLAKEIQLNMWVRFCRAAASAVGGRPADGVHIYTHRLPTSSVGTGVKCPLDREHFNIGTRRVGAAPQRRPRGPFAHRLRRAHPEQLGHRRSPRFVLTAHLAEHANRALAQLRRVPPRRVP